MAASLASADVANAAVLLGQCSRSSGSSSLGLPAQHAMTSVNQMIHQVQAQQSSYGQPFQGSHMPVIQGSQPKVSKLLVPSHLISKNSKFRISLTICFLNRVEKIK